MYYVGVDIGIADGAEALHDIVLSGTTKPSRNGRH